ncbi:MAG: universal stress protein [Deltaproteobacteria bacterium]|nr:universal stress protein [Deltaproteobacteria bacterium]NCP01908.1 universal stress protein [Deltaproteobacteria bacterium]
MIKQKILVPLDRSPISAHTREKLFAMKSHLNPPLVLLHVLDLDLLATQGFPEKSHAEFSQRARAEAEKFMQEQKTLFAAEGIEVETLLVEGPALETICEHADSGSYELVAIGRNPVSEMRDFLFGQVSNKLIHKVRCPVLVL